MILRNKKLFLLLKDSICEFILLSLVILLSRHSFIYIKIIQFRILQGNLSESSPVGWSVVCCNQTKVVPSHAYNRWTIKPPFCEDFSNKKSTSRKLKFILQIFQTQFSKHVRRDPTLHPRPREFSASSRFKESSDQREKLQVIFEPRKNPPKVFIRISWLLSIIYIHFLCSMR